jgi:hypothetical protein
MMLPGMKIRSAFLVGICLCGLNVAAQEKPPAAPENQETVQKDEVPLESADPFEGLLDLPEGTTLEEESELSKTPVPTLRQQGFVFSDTAQSTTSTTAALIALTAGIPIHGIGHYWIDDSRTSTALLASEGVAIGLMAGSALAAYADGGASNITGIAAPIFQLGFSGFILSYLLDVVGTLQGNQLVPPSNILNQRGFFAEVAYGFVTSTQASSRHVIRARAGVDFDAGHVAVETTQNLLLGAAEYRGILGARLFRVRPQTFLTMDVVGDYYQFSETGEFERIGAEARLGGSLDLGAFFSQFNQVAVGMWFGAGRQYFAFGNGFDSHTDFLSHQTFFHLNLTKKLNMRLAHGSHPASIVPSLSRLFGVTDLEFVYATTFGFLKFRTELGDGAAFWLGGDVRF